MKRLVMTAGILMLVMPAVLAQQAKPVVEAEPTAPALSMRNISLELTITDQSSAADSAKKVVSMIIGDRQRGSIRTSGALHTPAEGHTSVILNVDARPQIRPDSNTIMMSLTIEYFPKLDPASETKNVPRTQLNQSMSLLLDSGKPTVISQSADPGSNRKVVVEVKATILK
jgi:hypothetical protein